MNVASLPPLVRLKLLEHGSVLRDAVQRGKMTRDDAQAAWDLEYKRLTTSTWTPTK